MSACFETPNKRFKFNLVRSGCLHEIMALKIVITIELIQSRLINLREPRNLDFHTNQITQPSVSFISSRSVICGNIFLCTLSFRH